MFTCESRDKTESLTTLYDTNRNIDSPKNTLEKIWKNIFLKTPPHATSLIIPPVKP